MISGIFREELVNHLRSFRFWAGAVLAILLAASSTLVAVRDFELRRGDFERRAAQHDRALRQATVYSFVQPVVVRPPEPLSVLDQGFDARLGTEVRVHLFAVPAEAAGAYRGNEILVPLTEIDLTTVVGVILGLLALLLGGDAVVADRERGNLRAMLASGASRPALLAGKLLGGLAALGLPLAAALAVSLIVLGFETGVTLTPDRVAGVGLLSAAYLGYLGLMLLFGLLISVRARNRSQALLASVLLWLVAVLVLPVVAGAVARDLTGVQQARRATERRLEQMTAERDRILSDALARAPGLTRLSGHTAISFASGPNRAARYRYGSKSYYGDLATYYRFETDVGLRYAERMDQEWRDAESRSRVRERLGALVSGVSPAFLLERVSESLAGTSIEEHHRFLAACRAYREDLLSHFRSQDVFGSWRWFTDDEPSSLHPWPRFLGLEPDELDDKADIRSLLTRLNQPAEEERIAQRRRELESLPSRRLALDDLPAFVYESPGVVERLRRIGVEIASAGLLAVLLAALAWSEFHRREVR